MTLQLLLLKASRLERTISWPMKRVDVALAELGDVAEGPV